MLLIIIYEYELVYNISYESIQHFEKIYKKFSSKVNYCL